MTLKFFKAGKCLFLYFNLRHLCQTHCTFYEIPLVSVAPQSISSPKFYVSRSQLFDRVKPLSMYNPVGHRNVVSRARWSLVTGWVTWKFGFCKKCGQDLLLCDVNGLSRQVNLYTIHCYRVRTFISSLPPAGIPRIVSTSETVLVSVGHQATLTCEALGTLPLTFIWTRGDIQVYVFLNKTDRWDRGNAAHQQMLLNMWYPG